MRKVNNINRVSVIILNYNNYEDTIECIDSFLKNIEENIFDIVIVDNNSTNESINYLNNKYENNPRVNIIVSKKNDGYANGNNVGVKFALANFNNKYICILNNDTIIQNNFLRSLINRMDKEINIGIISPMLCEYYDEKIVQSTGGIIDLKRGRIDAINHGKHINEVEKIDIECDYVGGACLLVRSNIFTEAGFIPEDYFLFFEETEWCIKVKKLGYKIICDTNNFIVHKGSASINSVKGLSEYFFFRNRVLFERRNAKNNELFVFYIYLLMETIYRVIFKGLKIKNIQYYFDGMREKNKFKDKNS
ncbi:MAG: glycosyltransferase family 2 protein [Sarcina sp.]